MVDAVTASSVSAFHSVRRMTSGRACKWQVGFKIQDTRYKIQDTRYKIQDTRYKIQDTRYKIQDTRYKNLYLTSVT